MIDIKQCHIIKSYNKGTDKVVRLKSLDLEFISKTSGNFNILLNFFNIDDDLSEDFEVQRIEKWHQLILTALPKESKIKLAS